MQWGHHRSVFLSENFEKNSHRSIAILKSYTENYEINVKEKTVKIPNTKGLHARAALILANEAEKFDSEIILSNKKKHANAKYIMELMMLAASFESEVNIKVTGPDESKAMQTILNTVESGFNEIE